MLYDIPGIQFRDDGPPDFRGTPAVHERNIQELLDKGISLVFLPSKRRAGRRGGIRRIVGGQFCISPRAAVRRVKGFKELSPRSDAPVSIVADGFRVTRGCEAFSITDELYLYEVFEDDVVPLLRSGPQFARQLLFRGESGARRQDVLERQLGPRARQQPYRLGEALSQQPDRLSAMRRRSARL